ncbi:MAG: hypothetical protein ACKO4T_07560 [Planctomycetaceae bacterium]
MVDVPVPQARAVVGPLPPSWRFMVRFSMRFLRRSSTIASVTPPHARRPAVCALLVVALWSVPAWGQPGAVPTGATPTPPAVEELRPEVFYLEGDGGRLVPVPGFRYRDFVELFRIREGLAGPVLPPGAVLESLALAIDARDSAPQRDEPLRTACPATAEFSIRQVATGWTPLPLELGELVLTAPPRHDGPGRMVLDVAPDGHGYRAWFDAVAPADGDARHTVVLEGRLPLESAAVRDACAVHLPAAVTSRIDVRSARRSPVVDVAPDSAETTVADAAGGGSEVTIRGVAGHVRVRIGDAAARGGRGPAAQAASESTVRVDGRTAVTEGVIRLAGLAAGSRRLTISLPQSATVREVRPPATLLARGGTAEAPTVDVGVTVGTDGRAVVELACERPVDSTGAVPFDGIGLAVGGIEPWRQWGRVSLIVDGDWLVTWGDEPQVRRVDPPAAVDRGFVAAFAYDALPASLPLRVRPRRSRLVVEPDYRYDVSANRVTLDARFRVAARGAAVGGLTIGVDPAWVIDEVGPPGAVDAAASTAEDGLLVVPFAQPLAGDMVVEVRATLPVSREAGRVGWNLPVPRADVVGPAGVVIASQSDIELLPDNEATVGLVRQSAASSAAAGADRTALVYRLDASDGVFAANRRFLPRRVEAAIAAQLDVDATEVTVEQVIRLNVLHLPLESIELAVPDTVVAAGGITVRSGGALLDSTEVGPVEAPAETAEGSAADAVAATRFRTILPEPLIGPGEITVSFRLPAAEIPPRSTLAVDVPLVHPVDAALGRETAAITAPDAIVVGVRGDAWRRDVAPASATAQAWAAVKVQRSIPLALSTRAAETTRGLVIEAAWLQTRILPTGREEVRHYVISSARDSVAMTLPELSAGAGWADVAHEVRLDGDIVPAGPGGGRLVVELPRVDPNRRWRLDVRTTIRRAAGWAGWAAALGLPGRLQLKPPAFEPPVREQRFYWTIHVRPDEHVLGLPAGWTSQQAWRRSTLGWELRSSAGPINIETWLAAAANRDPGGDVFPRGFALPPLAERSVVYSGVGPPGAAVVWVVPTWCLVLLSSGVSLAAAFAAIHRPGWRRPGLWVAIAAGLTLAAAAAPSLVPLVAQAAVPGVLLGGLGWALHSISTREPRRDPAPVAGTTAPSSLTRLTDVAHASFVPSGIEEASTRTQPRNA